MSEDLNSFVQDTRLDESYIIRVPKSWMWKPREDVTPYEVAMCLPALLCIDGYQRDRMIASMPDNFARHFEEIVK